MIEYLIIRGCIQLGLSKRRSVGRNIMAYIMTTSIADMMMEEL